MTVDSAFFPTGDAPPFVTRLLALGAARREALPAPSPGAAPAASRSCPLAVTAKPT